MYSNDFDLSTDRSLLNALRHQSSEAWAMVATVYGPLLRTWAKSFVTKEADVMDVSQIVLLAVIKYSDRFRKEHPQDSFRKWLYTITRNESRRLLNRENETINMMEKIDQIAESDPQDEIDTESNDLLTALQRRALFAVKQAVNTRTWDIYWEAIRGELSTEAIAERFGTTQGNVRVIKVRLTNRIRELLDMTDFE
jgi:RNA polymerase sigma factor (sigma-70 family)